MHSVYPPKKLFFVRIVNEHTMSVAASDHSAVKITGNIAVFVVSALYSHIKITNDDVAVGLFFNSTYYFAAKISGGFA